MPDCQQANGGAVIVGDGVNATFDLCTFVGNGVPPCAEVQSTLVRPQRCLLCDRSPVKVVSTDSRRLSAGCTQKAAQHVRLNEP